MSTELSRIDSHHHLWDLSVRPQDWLDAAGLEPINRSFSLEDYRAAVSDSGIDGSVLVETVDVAAEIPELLAIADAEPMVLGVVGWVDLTTIRVTDDLSALRSGSGGDHLVAVRHQVQGEPDPRWLCRDDVRHGLAAVGAAGLAFDLLVVPSQLPAAIETVQALPDCRFVLAHAGKPDIRSGALDPWQADVRRLAELPNVAAKLSGLSTEADLSRWSDSDFDPYVEVMIEAFGPSRLMWGSDWPVCTLAAAYAEQVRLGVRWTAALTDAERTAVWSGTATQWYQLPPPPARRNAAVSASAG